jgi:hypothetical protein
VARLSLGAAFVAVLTSIATFVALLATSSPGWGVIALNRVSEVLVLLSVASALAVERRPIVGAWQAQIAAAAVAFAFVVVALAKLYAASSSFSGFDRAETWAGEAAVVGLAALAFGLIGPRVRVSSVRLGFAAAALAALGCAAYAISLELGIKAFIWYSVAATAASLAASAAARMARL